MTARIIPLITPPGPTYVPPELPRPSLWQRSYRIWFAIVLGAAVGFGASYFTLPAPLHHAALRECGWEGCNK